MCPGIVRWPGYTTPGTTSDEPISGVDLLPTLCEIVGISLPEDRTLTEQVLYHRCRDRRFGETNRSIGNTTTLAPILKLRCEKATGKYSRRWTFAVPVTADITAERTQIMKTAGLERFELYNLRADIAESDDLSTSEPEKLESMKSELIDLYQEVQSETPQWPPWKHERYEANRIVWPDYWLQKTKK